LYSNSSINGNLGQPKAMFYEHQGADSLTVSGWRLARRREMVSRPLEKIRSTATAEPSQAL